jgi:hypothetical protein
MLDSELLAKVLEYVRARFKTEGDFWVAPDDIRVSLKLKHDYWIDFQESLAKWPAADVDIRPQMHITGTDVPSMVQFVRK